MMEAIEAIRDLEKGWLPPIAQQLKILNSRLETAIYYLAKIADRGEVTESE